MDYSLVYSELIDRFYKWMYPPVVSTEPLQEANNYWLPSLQTKYAVWVIEGAYLRYKYMKRQREYWDKCFKEACARNNVGIYK